jgi:SAM-dependent methyltransferase
MSGKMAGHERRIVETFTKTAGAFAEMPAHSDAGSMALLLRMAGIGGGDRVLDVACGPGLVSCAAAGVAKEVVGVDVTPGMIERAREMQRDKGVGNVSFVVGDGMALPFEAGSFSVVLSRYAFHHLEEPGRVLREMVRVCAEGGRVVVADVFTTSDGEEVMYNRVEKLRDASHVRALRREEFGRMFEEAGVRVVGTEGYRLEVGLEELLRASMTAAGKAAEVRRLLAGDVGRNETGMMPKRVAGEVRFSFPVMVVVGEKK